MCRRSDFQRGLVEGQGVRQICAVEITYRRRKLEAKRAGAGLASGVRVLNRGGFAQTSVRCNKR